MCDYQRKRREEYEDPGRVTCAYKAVIDRFIEEAAQWDGSLPVESFFEAWVAVERRKVTVELQAHIEDDRLVLMAPAGSPLRVQDNRIWLDDGQEVVIKLVSDVPSPSSVP